MFEKCTMACSTSFCKKHSTSIINIQNIFFCSLLLIFSWIFQFHWFIWSLYFRTFTIAFGFFLLGCRRIVSWGGRRSGVAKFTCLRWTKNGWNAINFGIELSSAHSPTLEVNPFHVIFYLNGVLVATHFDKGIYGKLASQIVILKLRLKEFLERCVAQFHVYIWFPTQRHNIYNYLDQIWHETQILIEPSKVLNQTFCMQNPHFLPNKHGKPIFHKNLDVFFSMFLTLTRQHVAH